MSFEQDSIPYFSTKGTDAMESDLFFAPDPQLIYAPSVESFDQEVDNDKEVEDLQLELSFKEIDDLFAPFHDTIPAFLSPSDVTYSTESGWDVSSSQYSSDFTLSEYSLPSEIESRGSADDRSYGAHASIYPTTFPLSAAVHVVPGEALAPDLPSNASSMDLNCTHSNYKTQPVKPFRCPICPFSSKRSYNLNTHVETHFKSKRFECHACDRSFTRKHDRKRHRESAHGEQKSSASSVSGISKRSVDPTLGRRNRCITLKGDRTSMSSAYPDFDAAIDDPVDITAWLLGV